jgi:hypothetical protein
VDFMAFPPGKAAWAASLLGAFTGERGAERDKGQWF